MTESKAPHAPDANPDSGQGQAVPAANAGRPRRSQAERRREMTDLLVEATLDGLQASGYHGASLSDILGRAGVSRGAWAHYFSSKAEMVAFAAERMLRGSVDQTAELAGIAGTPEERLTRLMEEGWRRFYQGRHRDVLFDLAVACRTDADLRTRLAPVFADFLAALGRAWGLQLATTPTAGVAAEELMGLTVYLLRGMAMQEIVAGPSPRNAELRRLWAGLLGRLLAADGPG